MKTSIWTVVILAILVAVGAFVLIKKDAPPYEVSPENVSEGDSASILALLKNAKITVPDSDAVVTLKDGEALFEIAPDSASEGIVTLVDDVSAVWKEEGKTDLAAVFAVNTGGTGTFLYLVLFDVSGGTFTKRSEAFLGDRIEVTNVGIGELVHDFGADYRITVQTLVRGESEPFAATPTVPETRTFYVTDQLLQEIEVGRDDT